MHCVGAPIYFCNNITIKGHNWMGNMVNVRSTLSANCCYAMLVSEKLIIMGGLYLPNLYEYWK